MIDEALVRELREKARVLYEGKVVRHRSCGIALAETFGREPRAYQALRKGGLTGEGTCGAIVAGGLVLGELFGDPDPAGPATPALKEAMALYHAEVARRIDRGGAATTVCNDLTARFADFAGEDRAAFCTGLVETVAGIVAEIALKLGAPLEATPIRGP